MLPDGRVLNPEVVRAGLASCYRCCLAETKVEPNTYRKKYEIKDDERPIGGGSGNSQLGIASLNYGNLCRWSSRKGHRSFLLQPDEFRRSAEELLVKGSVRVNPAAESDA